MATVNAFSDFYVGPVLICQLFHSVPGSLALAHVGSVTAGPRILARCSPFSALGFPVRVPRAIRLEAKGNGFNFQRTVRISCVLPHETGFKSIQAIQDRNEGAP